MTSKNIINTDSTGFMSAIWKLEQRKESAVKSKMIEIDLLVNKKFQISFSSHSRKHNVDHEKKKKQLFESD